MVYVMYVCTCMYVVFVCRVRVMSESGRRTGWSHIIITTAHGQLDCVSDTGKQRRVLSVHVRNTERT